MSLSEKQLALIRQSFDTLRKDPVSHSTEFYEALFRRAPQLRNLFRDDLSNQGMRFMTTLGAIVDNMHDPEALSGRYAELGKGHRALGVKAEDFEPMGEALLETLEKALGDAFTPEMRAAWAEAYDEMAREIIERGDIEHA
ncbi:globin domain-containing protein [Roseovarius salinarum]|uniref:globin domain-containing protein n=1 Tax=Roseovarius salinarum TaxID=1981892 RepID=UPI000C330B86|nr:globin domain-containing protein [Roseovarius salinarum]